MPRDNSYAKPTIRVGGLWHLKKSSARRITIPGLLPVFWPGLAAAQSMPNQGAESLLNSIPAIDQPAVLLLAIFGGAMSFALLSAFWLIREKAKTGTENAALRASFTSTKASRDRLQAMLSGDGECVAIWDGEGTKLLGTLAAEINAPADGRRFFNYGEWLTTHSAIRLAEAISSLRETGEHFRLELESENGAFVGVQGRVSGGYAFARFTPLAGTRQDLLALRKDHQKLLSRFSLIETLFETMPSPIWLRTGTGDFEYANAAYRKAVDAQTIDEVTEGSRELFDRAERRRIEEGLKSDQSFRGELPAICAGDRRVVETVVVSSDAGIAGIAIDRSDAEKIRTTLKHTVAGHQHTFDHLAAAVAVFDAKQRLQFYNTSFLQTWGLTVQQLSDQPSNSEVLEILRSTKKVPETGEWQKWKQGLLARYQATETLEDYWHLPDGRTLRVVINPQNQGGTSWVFENVTEELQLKSSYNALIQVQGETLDHLNEAVAVFGSDGRLKLNNPAFAAFTRNLDGIAEGVHINDLAAGCVEGLENSQDFEAIRIGITGMSETMDDLEGTLEYASGNIYAYSLVRLPGNQQMLTVSDITASVNVERALKERNEALEESDALKTRFIQRVSYELRAPLTTISGFTEILASEEPGRINEKQSEYLGYISRSSDVLKSLIDDILDLASIDAGAMELEFRELSLREAVEASFARLRDRADRFQLKLQVDIDTDVERVIGDEERLGQVIYNLLANAAAVSPDGGKIRVSGTSEGHELLLAVEDEGPGIAPEILPTIFERFESGKGREHSRGAGLGLSIVRSFIELHGGSVQAENRTDRGARFVCRIPLDPQAQLEAAE